MMPFKEFRLDSSYGDCKVVPGLPFQDSMQHVLKELPYGVRLICVCIYIYREIYIYVYCVEMYNLSLQ